MVKCATRGAFDLLIQMYHAWYISNAHTRAHLKGSNLGSELEWLEWGGSGSLGKPEKPC